MPRLYRAARRHAVAMPKPQLRDVRVRFHHTVVRYVPHIAMLQALAEAAATAAPRFWSCSGDFSFRACCGCVNKRLCCCTRIRVT